ncbi:hypothetical protein CH379_009335 [Leptospira ellisii]|uniref:Cyanophage baseplate Pam3 plug gp18 domain-containing protein n=1 Tax=Leptospira ellisii TaxID=2023197 RepID=A0A2N0BES6_9LEPT|nr:hypothetical protein [Leptospira ellisii]MDV6235828.1 hypothetical protein [Leptospira ellisii]PJZ93689.1 hypothetical protein CH379_06555 [Leptospira ellisii]PKA02489.1 hypothetical protein CH375_22790 [Leptospira ellisii]
MNEYTYLPIDPGVFPIRYTFTLDESDYEFEFSHNAEGDFISASVRDQDGNDLFATKLVYGVPLNHAVVDGFPDSILLTPWDVDDFYRDGFEDIPVNSETFGSRVKLYLGERK